MLQCPSLLYCHIPYLGARTLLSPPPVPGSPPGSPLAQSCPRLQGIEANPGSFRQKGINLGGSHPLRGRGPGGSWVASDRGLEILLRAVLAERESTVTSPGRGHPWPPAPAPPRAFGTTLTESDAAGLGSKWHLPDGAEVTCPHCSHEGVCHHERLTFSVSLMEGRLCLIK